MRCDPVSEYASVSHQINVTFILFHLKCHHWHDVGRITLGYFWNYFLVSRGALNSWNYVMGWTEGFEGWYLNTVSKYFMESLVCSCWHELIELKDLRLNIFSEVSQQNWNIGVAIFGPASDRNNSVQNQIGIENTLSIRTFMYGIFGSVTKSGPDVNSSSRNVSWLLGLGSSMASHHLDHF